MGGIAGIMYAGLGILLVLASAVWYVDANAVTRAEKRSVQFALETRLRSAELVASKAGDAEEAHTAVRIRLETEAAADRAEAARLRALVTEASADGSEPQQCKPGCLAK